MNKAVLSFIKSVVKHSVYVYVDLSKEFVFERVREGAGAGVGAGYRAFNLFPQCCRILSALS